MDPTPTLLLKLHGSVNWRVRRGHSRPYSIDAIVHDEPWLPWLIFSDEMSREAVKLHLEPDPFIVPPVLVKSVLVEQPILRVVWSLAYQKLTEAEEVVFVGYSLPITDIAASFLFGEALSGLPTSKVRVVNHAKDKEGQEALRQTYQRVFPEIGAQQFEFRDALDWSREFATTAQNAKPTAIEQKLD